MDKIRKPIRIRECTCEQCGKKYQSACNNPKFCSRICRDFYLAELKYKDAVENIDYVVCKWCGMKVHRIYGRHVKDRHPDKIEAMYKQEFPDALMCTAADKISTSKNSGQHMRQEKYRNAAADAMRGEKNPNHKSKTDATARKAISPYSIEFYRKKHPDLSEDELERMRLEKMNSAIAKRVLPSQPLYWISRGFTPDEAKIQVSAHQRTFTKEKLIAKYGEEEGLLRWSVRQQKWKDKVYNKNTCISGGVSTVALELFEALIYKIGRNYTFLYDKAEKIMHDGIRPYKYDFTIVEKKKIIEFNGTYWHCDPRKYKPDYYHHVKKMTAQQIWEIDAYKKELAEKHGYSVLYVWENDFDIDPLGTIKKCIDFLNA